MTQPRSESTQHSPSHAHILWRFARNEEGVITIFTIFILIMMLMVAGVGVDLMHNEMRRTALQNTIDRAVLAAADLDQPRTPTEVVEDYFAKAGMSDHLTSVVPTQSVNFRNVTATAYMESPTQFMSLFGVDSLPVPAFGQAIEDVPNVEISLVLDYSQSMDSSNRLNNLQDAAAEFIDIVLEGAAEDATSINLVPYAGQVNPGVWMFNRLGGTRYAATPLDEDDGGIPEHQSHMQLPDGAEGGEGSDPNLRYVYPNVSSCIEFADAAFDDDRLTVSVYNQTPHFDGYNHNRNALFAESSAGDGSTERVTTQDGVGLYEIEWGWCPTEATTITYASNDADALKSRLRRMPMYDGTGTPYGMKWGLALLNPASQPLFQEMSAPVVGLVPAEFANRPAAYDDEESVKYIVLMTDGGVTAQYRPDGDFDPLNLSISLNKRTPDRDTQTNKSENIDFFYAQCNLAKDPSRNIIVYTIAFEANSTARTEMRNCASSDGHFFTATGKDEIAAVFSTIARQINELRLTQ